MDQLADVLSKNNGASVYGVYRPHVNESNSKSAIKSATISDTDVDEGVYVAVPVSSFQPRHVQKITNITID